MTSRTKETSEEKSEKWASPHPREPWESPGSRDNRYTGSERRSRGWKKRTVSTVHKTSESPFFPSSSPRPEIGNLFCREIELKRLSTQGIKQARGKWGNWVENMGTKQKPIYKRVESLYTSSTLSQNPGRQLNFPLESLKKEPQDKRPPDVDIFRFPIEKAASFSPDSTVKPTHQEAPPHTEDFHSALPYLTQIGTESWVLPGVWGKPSILKTNTKTN